VKPTKKSTLNHILKAQEDGKVGSHEEGGREEIIPENSGGERRIGKHWHI